MLTYGEAFAWLATLTPGTRIVADKVGYFSFRRGDDRVWVSDIGGRLPDHMLAGVVARIGYSEEKPSEPDETAAGDR